MPRETSREGGEVDRSKARRTRRMARALGVASLLGLGAGGATADAPPALIRVFEMTASRFKFEPETLQVTAGDRVRLTVRSTDTEHGFAIKKLNVKVAVPKTGDPVTVDF